MRLQQRALVVALIGGIAVVGCGTSDPMKMSYKEYSSLSDAQKKELTPRVTEEEWVFIVNAYMAHDLAGEKDKAQEMTLGELLVEGYKAAKGEK